jgi:hypothetical protein
VKALEAQRDELKQTAIASLEAVGGTYTDDFGKATLVVPTELKVDLGQLQRHVSVRKFAELTRRVPVTDKIRAHITAGTFSFKALTALTFEDGTPRVVITRQVG